MIDNFSSEYQEETQISFEESYQSLVRALRRKKGFGLFFAIQSDIQQGDRLIERISKDLPEKCLEILEIEKTTQNLFDQIDDLWVGQKPDIIFIRGLEKALYGYEDTKRISGWSSEDIYAYSWKDVPPILSHLNRQREIISERFQCSLVFLVSKKPF